MDLSEQIMADVHAGNCHSVTDADGHCTCYIGRWHDEVTQLESSLAEAREEIERLREAMTDAYMGLHGKDLKTVGAKLRSVLWPTKPT